MIQLEQTIVALLYTENYVVVPGFGGFVAHEVPSRLDAHQFRIHPPRKELRFNPRLRSDDGLLVHKLVSDKGISYTEASMLVEKVVSKWKETIHSGNELYLESLGTIRQIDQSAFIFQQLPFVNFLSSSFGLEIAKALPVNKRRESRKPISVKPPKPEPIIIERLPVSYKRFRNTSIALIVLLSLSASYLYLLSFNTSMVDKAGLNFFNLPVIDTVDEKELEETQRLLELLQEDKKKFEAMQERGKDSEIDQTPETDSTPENTISADSEPEIVDKKSSSIKYHVIVSSLRSVGKLDEEVRAYRLKGYEPIILPTEDGSYRISIGSFASKDSANTFKRNVFNDNRIESWILPN